MSAVHQTAISLVVPERAPTIVPYSVGQKARILFFSVMATLIDGIDLAILLYFLAPISKHFGVSLASVSVIVGGAQVAGILGAVVFGHISDRYGRKPALAISVATFSLFTLLSGLTNSYEIFFVARMLVGFGLGGEVGIAYALVNETFLGANARRGLASAMLQSMFTVGGVLAAGIYSLGANRYGVEAWRWVFGYLGLAAVMAIAILAFMPESRVWQAYRLSQPGTSARPPFIKMFRPELAPKIIIATLMMTFAWAAIYVPATYAPTVWQTVYRLTPSQVGLVGAISSFLLGAGFLATGAISDRFGRRSAFSKVAWFSTAAHLLFVVAAAGYLAIHGSTNEQLWVVTTYCLAHASCSFFGVQGSWISEILPIDVRTSAFNFIYYVSRGVGGGLLPIIVLLGTTQLGLGLEFVVAFGVVGALGAAVLSYFLPEIAIKDRIVQDPGSGLSH